MAHNKITLQWEVRNIDPATTISPRKGEFTHGTRVKEGKTEIVEPKTLSAAIGFLIQFLKDMAWGQFPKANSVLFINGVKVDHAFLYYNAVKLASGYKTLIAEIGGLIAVSNDEFGKRWALENINFDGKAPVLESEDVAIISQELIQKHKTLAKARKLSAVKWVWGSAQAKIDLQAAVASAKPKAIKG